MRSSSAPAASTRPEHQLILWCARTRLDVGRAEPIQAMLREGLDVAYVAATALRHNVEPLLYWHLKALCPEAVPAAWTDLLRPAFERSVRRSLNLTAELCLILEAFEANGILAVPYKGPTLAALAYGNLALRDFIDLDFLVRSQDIAEACKLLVAQGYRLELDLPAARETSPQRVPGQYLFTRPGSREIVELHTPLTLRYYPVPLDLDRLRQRLQAVALGGREIRTFSAEDSLTLLCVHSSKHFWERLKWVCDIAELVQIPRGINWELAQEEARRLGCERMLFLGLRLANDLFEAPLPEEVLRRVQASGAVQSLAANVQSRLFRDDLMVPGVAQRLFFRLRMSENLWDGVRYCLRLATSPTEEDWSRVRLPAPLAPLYSVLRPLRLLRSHGLGLARRRAPDLAPFQPAPPEVVESMLALAELGPGDVLYDLGCGDGRVVVTAAKRFGIRAVGVDIDPRRIAEAKANARRHGVRHLVQFLQQDLKTVDVSEATVVILYLGLAANILLRQKLLEQLRAGARVISADFDMADWRPAKTERLENPGGVSRTIYLWRVEKSANQTSPGQDFPGRVSAEIAGR